MHRPTRLDHRILFTTLLIALSAWAAPPPPGTRITIQAPAQPQPLAVLARQLTSADITQQWEFAAIALDVLLETYHTELQTSVHDKASTPARRAKLARWQGATRGLIAQLEAARRKLAEGAQFSIHVDRRDQILILAGGQNVVVSGPRATTEDSIATSILRQFCSYNDCSMLRSEPPDPKAAVSAVTGGWAFGQRMRPSYQIGAGLRCEFQSLENRASKARVCERLAAELQQLAEGLKQALKQGHQINWERLLRSPPNTTPPYIVLNRKSAFLELDLKLLNTVDGDEWQDMVEWLRRELDGRPGPLVIMRTGRLLVD